jgi:hypothetical protein
MRRAPVLIALGVASMLAFSVAPAMAQHRGGGGGGRAAGGRVGGGGAAPRGSFAVRGGGSFARVGGGGSFARVGGFNRAAVAPRGNFAVRGGYYGGGARYYGGGGRYYAGGRYYGGAGYYGGRYYAPARFYRPYYAFRSHFSLGFGLFIGYPVSYGYPYYYPYDYYPYPYPSAYPYAAPYPYPYAGAYPAPYSTPAPTYSEAYPPGAQNSVGVEPNVPQSVQANTGGLSFEITPSDAHVIIDGHDLGTVGQFTPSSQPLGLPAGRHHVEIVANGYHSMSSDVDVVAGQVIPFQGVMER